MEIASKSPVEPDTAPEKKLALLRRLRQRGPEVRKPAPEEEPEESTDASPQ